MKNFKFDKKTDNLFKAILSLNSTKECEAFFRDLCTIEELKEMSERWAIVLQLNQGVSYRQISDNLGVSTTTVSRVALWLNDGMGGYRSVLNNLMHHRNLNFEKRR